VRADHVDHRTDIFALGVLLFELLAAAPPFREDTAAEIMTATLRADPADLPAGVPDGLQRIVRRCLEKNPDERFQSADDLAFALRQLTGSSSGHLVHAGAFAPPTVSRMRRAQLHLWFSAAGFALGLIGAGIAMSR
jgi:serine/threonine protein kinase